MISLVSDTLAERYLTSRTKLTNIPIEKDGGTKINGRYAMTEGLHTESGSVEVWVRVYMLTDEP